MTTSFIDSGHILHRLREMFGEDHIQLLSGNHFRIANEDTRVVAFPSNIGELSEMLRFASSENWRVIPAGAGTWLEMGNRPSGQHLIISTSRMNRVLEYEPADLTATVEAGCTLTDFNKLATEHRQFIPLDPFGDENSTIGGIIATASSGPLRCAYGTPRDWLIGIRVVHADGTITKAGGKVVKNVAGYDLCKLYTGSFGTLAVIAEMSFKLRSLPSSDKTVLFNSDDLNALCSLVSQISDSDVQPASCEMLSPGNRALPAEDAQYTLSLRFLDEAEAVNSQIDQASSLGSNFRMTRLSDDEALRFQRNYRESETDAQWDFSFRLSVLPSDLNVILNDLKALLPQARWRAHAANGVIRAHAEAEWLEGLKTAAIIAELRRRAQSRGGHLVIVRATDEVREQLGVWGEAGATANLMQMLKEKFDPNRQLNPGRFVAGI